MLIKNTSIYVFGNTLPKIASFFLLPIYTKYLSPSDYGVVQAMVIISTLLSIFFTLAIERSIFRLIYDYRLDREKREYLGTLFISIILIATIVFMLVYSMKQYLALLFPTIPFYPYYLFIMITSYLTIFSHIPKIMLQVKERAIGFILLSISEFVISSILILYLLIYHNSKALAIISGNMLTGFILLPIYIYITYGNVAIAFNKNMFLNAFKYSWPIVPGLLFATVINYSDRFFIERYLTLADVGIYSLGFKLSQILLILSQGFNRAYVPIYFKYANRPKQHLSHIESLFTINKLYMVALIYASTVIILFAKDFITVLDDRYIQAYMIVPLLITGILLNQFSSIYAMALKQVKKTKINMYLVLSFASLNVILNYYFVPKYGTYGAGTATLITFIVAFIVRYRLSIKYFYIPIALRDITLWSFIYGLIILLSYSNIISDRYLLIMKIILFILISVIAIVSYKDIVMKYKHINS